MRVILRSCRRNLYYASANKWTPEPGQAQDFRKCSNAIEYACEHELADVEVVFEFKDRRFNFTLGPMNFVLSDQQRIPEGRQIPRVGPGGAPADGAVPKSAALPTPVAEPARDQSRD